MRIAKRLQLLFAIVMIAVAGAAGWYLRGRTTRDVETERETATSSIPTSKPSTLELSEQARKNLKLVSKAARPTDYWRTVMIPGVVSDRPGISDRGVTSPAVGIITEIHAFPGDTVQPGDRLVSVRLFSEYLQATQTQLFQASQEVQLVQGQIERIGDATVSGAVSGSRLVDLRNELKRQQTQIRASRQELLNRGLSVSQIDAVAEGTFVSSIDVVAPPKRVDADLAYEMQSLAVELGQTVQAGQRLASLANHQELFVVGHAFKREAGLLERAAKDGHPVQIEFVDDAREQWPESEQAFQIRHLSNAIDVESRTFDFFIPLSNQHRTYTKDGETFFAWRYRPGQRARIRVPVEKYESVFVLPAEAVVREGAEMFVYRQNGDLFKQIPVHTIHEDRFSVVIANDGSITPGTYLAQNAAASLRRILKAQSASGEQPGFHVHADGTVHASH